MTPYPKDSHIAADEIGGLIVTDSWGPAHTRGIRGETYFTPFTDVFSRYSVIYYSRDKTDRLDHIKTYCDWLHTQTGKHVKHIRFDNGKEFLNAATTRFL